jgi:hypothetical protein
MRFGFVDQALDEHPEESPQVRMCHQQIERELHRIALDRRHALRAMAIVSELTEGASQLRDRFLRINALATIDASF